MSGSARIDDLVAMLPVWPPQMLHRMRQFSNCTQGLQLHRWTYFCRTMSRMDLWRNETNREMAAFMHRDELQLCRDNLDSRVFWGHLYHPNHHFPHKSHSFRRTETALGHCKVLQHEPFTASFHNLPPFSVWYKMANGYCGVWLFCVIIVGEGIELGLNLA